MYPAGDVLPGFLVLAGENSGKDRACDRVDHGDASGVVGPVLEPLEVGHDSLAIHHFSSRQRARSTQILLDERKAKSLPRSLEHLQFGSVSLGRRPGALLAAREQNRMTAATRWLMTCLAARMDIHPPRVETHPPARTQQHRRARAGCPNRFSEMNLTMTRPWRPSVNPATAQSIGRPLASRRQWAEPDCRRQARLPNLRRGRRSTSSRTTCLGQSMTAVRGQSSRLTTSHFLPPAENVRHPLADLPTSNSPSIPDVDGL